MPGMHGVSARHEGPHAAADAAWGKEVGTIDREVGRRGADEMGEIGEIGKRR